MLTVFLLFFASLALGQDGIHIDSHQCFAPDHYLSYPLALTIPFPAEAGVTLEDQFSDYGDVEVLAPTRLLNPASKLHDDVEEFPQHENLHYTSFPVTIDGVPLPNPTGVNLSVGNQFAEEFIITDENLLAADSLLVPSAKLACPGCELALSDTSVAINSFGGDHYLCYPLIGMDPVAATGIVTDQFQERLFGPTITPSRLCNPVRKTHGGITYGFHSNPENHLMCFTIAPVNVRRDVSLLNQFGLQTGLVRNNDELCVPSSKANVISEAAAACYALAAPPAGSITRYVSPDGDDTDNDCTNRFQACETIAYAASNTVAQPGDVVELLNGIFPVPTEIVPTQATIFFFGQGPSASIADGGGGGNGNNRLFAINSGIEATFCGLTLTGGSITGAAGDGGAINNNGDTTVINSTVSGNSAVDGGAIYNTGELNIFNSTFSNNTATNGGAISNALGTTDINNSTFSANTGIFGGAIFNLEGNTTMANSTITENISSAAVDQVGGTLSAYHTIIGAQTAGANCFGAITDNGFNLESGPTCGFLGANNSLNNTAPDLGPLQDNGGPTPTHLPNAMSPAIDNGDLGCGVPTDQRGEPRPVDIPLVGLVGLRCDIGSVERQLDDI